MPSWVLIDFSGLAYRAFFTMPDLSHEDIPTGVILGVLEQLRTICSDKRLLTNRVALFFDSKQSYRRQIFPGYKKSRMERTPEEQSRLLVLYDQIVLMRDGFLPATGFSVHRQAGLEADDLIASAALWLRSKNQEGVMVTADEDLYQAISPAVVWWSPWKNEWLDQQAFWAKKGFFPERWAEVKALAGCHTDSVPGITGIGEGTAIRYLCGDLPSQLKRHGLITSLNGQLRIRINRELVTLPHPKTRPVELILPSYRMEEWCEWCARLGLRSILSGERGEWWKSFFDGQVGRSVRQRVRKRGEVYGS